MAQKEIEQWARILQESEAQEQAYENACDETLKELDDAINDVELGDEDEVIDPASLGFVDSENDQSLDEKTTYSPNQVKRCNIIHNDNNYLGYKDGHSIFVGAKKFLSNDIVKLNRDFRKSELGKTLKAAAELWEIDWQTAMIIFAEKNGWTISNLDAITKNWEPNWHQDAERQYGPYLDVDESEDPVDLAECGFTEDGEELAAKEAEEYLKEDFHRDDDFASIDLDIFDAEDGTGRAFADELKQEVPDVYARPSQKLGPNPIWKLTGTVKDLKDAYAFWLGLYSWKDVEDQGEAEGFWNSIVYEDGDTLQEADYREALAHVFDPVGVKASTANLKKNNVCELSLVGEAVKDELASRKIKKALQESDFGSLSDEDLAKLDSILDAKEAVDNGTSDEEEDKAWLFILKDMGLTMEQYKAMDPKEFDRRWEEYLKPPFEQANGFRKSDKVFRAYHRPDNENGGATHTDFQFNPEYYHRVTRAEAERNARKAQKAARDSMPIKFPKRGGRTQAGEKGTWTLAEFGKLLYSLGPKRAKELKKAMLEIAHEDNIGDPKAEAYEKMFIDRLFGKKNPTFRDIAAAWYPGQDPNTRQQSVNKFVQDTLGNFTYAVRHASDGTDGGRETFNKKILGNEANFKKFLDLMKEISQKRAKNKRSIINKDKKPADVEASDANTSTEEAK